jgi:sugar lactone lactonase YvrE
MNVEIAVNGPDMLGEGPVWSVREQALYWVDIRAPAVHRLDPSSGDVRTAALPAMVGSIGLRRDAGSLLVALQNGFHTLDFASGALTPVHDPEHHLPHNRFNDGRADRRGRFWAGTMRVENPTACGSLYRLDADHRCTMAREHITIPNSICWSPDDRVMYFADTPHAKILAFDFDIDEGRMGAARVFADLAGGTGKPDGSVVDADGCVWNAQYGGGRVVRYTPDGREDLAIQLPVTQVTCCAFGGPDLGTLYITTARQNLTPGKLAEQPLAGALFAVRPGVTGLPENEWGG